MTLLRTGRTSTDIKFIILFSLGCLLYPNYRDAFLSVVKSMESVGFAAEDIQQVMKVLATILHIGDIVS